MIDAALLVEQVAKALAALRHENPDMLDMLVDVYNIPAWQAKYGADARAAIATVLEAVAAEYGTEFEDYRETSGMRADLLEAAAAARGEGGK